jgi:hypothetical protein
MAISDLENSGESGSVADRLGPTAPTARGPQPTLARVSRSVRGAWRPRAHKPWESHQRARMRPKKTFFERPTGVGSPQGLYGFKADDFTAVTQTTATIQWRVNPDGSNVTECKFEIGTTISYGVSGPCKKLPGSGDVPVQVSTSASGLAPNTTYHYRVLSKSSKGTFEGPDIFFTTLRVTAPSVETKGSGSVGEKSATLYASVNPRGGTVSKCTFEYGTTTGYGSNASCSTLPGSGSSPVAVSATIASGLAANTEYHYRISATNSAGTTKATDTTFKTS